ncbi:hypothetical protein NFI96_034124, partial [Prochilodus magdalenae]
MEPHDSGCGGGTSNPNTLTHKGLSAMFGELLHECVRDSTTISPFTESGLSATFTDMLEECVGVAMSTSQQSEGAASPGPSAESAPSEPNSSMTQRATPPAPSEPVKRDWSMMERTGISSGDEPCEP